MHEKLYIDILKKYKTFAKKNKFIYNSNKKRGINNV